MKTHKAHHPNVPIQSRPLKPSSSCSAENSHIPAISYPQSTYATNLSKRHRTEKACDNCRRRKVRCELQQDGSICKQCLQTNGACTFTASPRKRGRPGVVQLEERLERLERLLADREQSGRKEHSNFNTFGQQNNGSRQMEENERSSSWRYPRPKDTIKGINDWIYRMCGIDKETSDTLVKIYFTYIYPVIPVVNKAAFLQQYRDQVDVLPSPPLLCAIYSVAMRYTESSIAFGNCTKYPLLNSTGQRTSDAWSHKHMDYIKCNQSPTLPAIQSLVISMQYRTSANSRWTDVWLLNSVAVRMAQDIGLHRNDQDGSLSESDKETRKRLWGLLYILDRWFSAGTGRPLAAFDEDCDETYPQPVYVDDLADKPMNPIHRSQQTNIPCATIDIMNYPQSPLFQAVAQLTKVSKILGNILHGLYTPAARKQCMETGSAELVGKLEESLGVWRSKLPPFLRITGTLVNWKTYGDESMTILSGVIGLAYYTSLILLHRPFIQMKSTPSSHLSLQVCTNAAIRTVDIIGKMQSRNHLLVSWSFIIYPVFVSSLIHVYNANSPSSMVADVARANLMRILATLQLFSKLSPLAEKLHTALYCVAQHRRYLPCSYEPLSEIPAPLDSRQSTTPPDCTPHLSGQNELNANTSISESTSSSLPTSSNYCNSIMDWIDSKCVPLSSSGYGDLDHSFGIRSLFALGYSDCSRCYSSDPFTSYSTLAKVGDNNAPATSTDNPVRLYDDFQLYISNNDHSQRNTAIPCATTATSNVKQSFYPGNIFWDLPSGMELNEWPTQPGTHRSL
ncbi:fungal-specific transcription factor domain-domain-containing protein [Absidia repens]|uniref:Fungal-specific transcription factor domain-domain-containing protein n=1 Tax=Absidia repens TaxID=90262 RepID=A0A1X2ITT7_9FUNG|nr:fungal-specific transcription factor domain-domain-containing protein [Absidia repens]